MTTTPTPVDPPRLHQNPAFTWGMIAPAGPTLYVGGQNGTDEAGAVQTGVVQKVTQSADGKPVLTVNGTEGVDPSKITQIA